MYFHAIEAVLIVFLSLTCLIGDFLISWHKVDTLIYLRIAADVGTHSAVGCLSWAIVIAPSCHWINLYEILLCGLLSGGLDVDHIFIASELNVKAFISLPNRPPFHNSLLMVAVSCVLFFISRISHFRQLHFNLPLMFTVAWFSHHLRDANRRGLWFGPWNSVPIPRLLYIIMVILSAYCARYSNKVVYTGRTFTEAVSV